MTKDRVQSKKPEPKVRAERFYEDNPDAFVVVKSKEKEEEKKEEK